MCASLPFLRTTDAYLEALILNVWDAKALSTKHVISLSTHSTLISAPLTCKPLQLTFTNNSGNAGYESR